MDTQLRNTIINDLSDLRKWVGVDVSDEKLRAHYYNMIDRDIDLLQNNKIINIKEYYDIKLSVLGSMKLDITKPNVDKLWRQLMVTLKSVVKFKKGLRNRKVPTQTQKD